MESITQKVLRFEKAFFTGIRREVKYYEDEIAIQSLMFEFADKESYDTNKVSIGYKSVDDCVEKNQQFIEKMQAVFEVSSYETNDEFLYVNFEVDILRYCDRVIAFKGVDNRNWCYYPDNFEILEYQELIKRFKVYQVKVEEAAIQREKINIERSNNNVIRSNELIKKIKEF